MSITERDANADTGERPRRPVDHTGRRRWYAPFTSPLMLCLLVTLIARVLLLVHTNGVIDGDEALVGIQAEHILRGAWPVYYYGQPYMGSLEAYLVALIFAIVGPTVWALRAEPILLSLVVVWLTWILAGMLADSAHLPAPQQRRFQIVAAWFSVLLPLYDMVIEMRTYGGYIETFILMLLLLILALHLTRRWQAGASNKEELLIWAAIGLVVGLGLWIYPLISSAILAAALWIVGYCVIEVVRRRKDAFAPALLTAVKRLLLAVVAIPACIIGLLPALIWGASNHWANVTFLRTLGGSWSLHRIAVSLNVSVAYSTCVAPHIVSGAIPTENTLLTLIHVLPLLIGMVYIALPLALLVTSFFRPSPALVRARALVGLPALFALCVSAVFCTSGVSVFALISCGYDATGRYATPLMLALPLFFATTYIIIRQYIDENAHTESQPRDVASDSVSAQPATSMSRFSNVAIGRTILLGALLLYFCVQTSTYILTDPGRTFQSNYCTIDPANDALIIDYMEREHIQYFWASNLLAYPIVFKTDSRIIGADPTPILHPNSALNRIPAYTNAVLRADRPSLMVMIQVNDPQPVLLQLLDAQHVTYREARFPSAPGYAVLIVTPLNRTVSPLQKGFDIFYCYPVTAPSS